MTGRVSAHPTGPKGTTVRILGISGSGRRKSYNSALLEAAKELLPKDAVLESYDVSGLPLFNADLEAEPPASARTPKEKIRAADAILFATPEHNYSVSAVLKNAIEWGNRPEVDNAWNGKPAAIMSASTSARGGARAQLNLRQIMVDLNIHPINRPQVLVARAQEKFDADLRLVDEQSRENLRDLLAALVKWTKKLQGDSVK